MNIKSLTTICILVFILSLSVSGQVPSFSGDWKLNREKSVLDPNQLFMSKITILIKADSLLTMRTYTAGDGQEYPFVENLSLDGKDCGIVIYDMPRKSKATISPGKDSINVESVTTFNGDSGEQNYNVSETWKLEDGGETLAISFTNSIAGNSTTAKHYFDKVK